MAIEISTIVPLSLSKFSMMESAVEIVNRPQRSGDLFNGVGPLAGSGFRGQEKIGGLRIADARGFERDDNLAVESILSKEAAVGRREDAHHRKLAAVQEDGAGNAVARREQSLTQRGADHADALPAHFLLAGKDPARLITPSSVRKLRSFCAWMESSARETAVVRLEKKFTRAISILACGRSFTLRLRAGLPAPQRI